MEIEKDIELNLGLLQGNTRVGKHLRREFEHLLSKYNVDVAINGHVHSYLRTCPLYNKVTAGLRPSPPCPLAAEAERGTEPVPPLVRHLRSAWGAMLGALSIWSLALAATS